MSEEEGANGAAGGAVVGGQNAGFEGRATHTLSNDGGSERSGTSGKIIIREKRKALAWKVIEEVEYALEKSENVPKRQLQKWKFTLETSLQQINDLDKAVLAEIMESGDEIAIEIEVESTSDFQTDINMTLENLKEALKKFSTAEKQEQGSSGRGDRANISAKLPKLNLRRFDGDPMKWMSFWDSFEGNIHNTPELSERDKLDYSTEQLSVWALSDLKYRNNKSFIKFLMLLSGDIHLHPGPSKICQTCNKLVRKGLPCTQCNFWVHKRCDQISDTQFATLSRLDKNEYYYTCLSCKNNVKVNLWQELPFANEGSADDPLHDLFEEQPSNTENGDETNQLPPEDCIWNPFRKRGLHFLHLNINPIVVGLFDSTILVGGGAKKPPYLTLLW